MNEDSVDHDPNELNYSHNTMAELLFSSVLYGVGATFNFVGHFLIWNRPPYRVWYRVISAIGVGLFWVPHALFEVQLDIVQRRIIAHMRYRSVQDDARTTTSTTAAADGDDDGSKSTVILFNLWQSLLFGGASLIQGIALLVPFPYYIWLNIAASLQFVASSLLWILSCCCIGKSDESCCHSLCCGCCRGGGVCDCQSLQRGLDTTGNVLYAISSLLLFLGALDQRANPNEFLGAFLQYGASIGFFVSGLFYVLADAIRLQQAIEKKQRIQQEDYTPL